MSFGQNLFYKYPIYSYTVISSREFNIYCIFLFSVATFGKRMSRGFGAYIRVSSLVRNLF